MSLELLEQTGALRVLIRVQECQRYITELRASSVNPELEESPGSSPPHSDPEDFREFYFDLPPWNTDWILVSSFI